MIVISCYLVYKTEKQPSLSLALVGKAPLKSIFKGLAVARTKKISKTNTNNSRCSTSTFAMAERRFRHKKGRNPDQLPANVAFIKKAAKEGIDTKKMSERAPRSVKAVLREEGHTF